MPDDPNLNGAAPIPLVDTVDDGDDFGSKSTTELLTGGSEVDDVKSTYEDKFNELSQTIAVLTGRLNERTTPAPTQQQQTQQAPKEFSYDMNAFADELAANAPAAMQKYTGALISHEFEKLQKNLLDSVNGKFNQQSSVQQRKEALNGDLSRIQSDFPEYKGNKEFETAWDQEVQTVVRERGGKTWDDMQPGDMYNAAARLALRWSREGKAPNMLTGRPSLKEVTTRVPPADRIANGLGAPRTGGPAKTIDQLFPNDPKSQAIARRISKAQGLTEERYVAAYRAAKEDGGDDFAG
jgi:hypothetical protein